MTNADASSVTDADIDELIDHLYIEIAEPNLSFRDEQIVKGLIRKTLVRLARARRN